MSRRRLAWALCGLALAGPAVADGPAAVPLLPEYRQECGACHVPFPPALLGPAAWQRVMGGLATHYGSDASLDAASAARISTWLQTVAGRGRRAADAPPEDRITRSPWFVREHREVPAAAWSRPAVRSAANCAACHLQAQEGAFDEHDVRIPR